MPERFKDKGSSSNIIGETMDRFPAFRAGFAAPVIPYLSYMHRQKERISGKKDSRIVYEPGVHLISRKDIESAYKAFINGNEEVNYWQMNPELTKRLSGYSPELLTVDGLVPVTDPSAMDFVETWLKNPGRPGEINPGGYYLASGDIIPYNEKASGLTTSSGKLKLSQQESDDILRHMLIEADNIADERRLGNLYNILGVLVSFSFLPGAVIANRSALTRRTLMKGLLAGAGILMSTNMLFEPLRKNFSDENYLRAAFADNTDAKEKSLQRVGILDGSAENEFIDCRTALLSAKVEDTANYLRGKGLMSDEAKSAVVLGALHEYKLNLYSGDRDARRQAITKLGRYMIGILDNYVIEPRHLMPRQRSQLINSLLDFLSTIDINRVSDPGRPEGMSTSEYVESNIKPVASIKSPQVIEALKELRFNEGN